MNCIIFSRLLLLILPLSILFCTAQVITYEQQLLSHADSLFKVGNYEIAKIQYAKIRDLKPESDAARTAQFYLGYINLYYDNPFANWEAALREFKTFAALYPDDIRIGEVNSLIRILIVLQTFKKEYKGTTVKLDELKAKAAQNKDLNRKLINFEQLEEALKNCYSDTDSLKRKNRDLESFIVELEKKCQQ